ncbi:MAG: hypothetical protein FWG77_02565 [Treponema sp.]|nr:hypothetical protein [Treponema sp.]
MTDYHTLAEAIYKRKSVRQYSDVSVEILESDDDLIETFEVRPLIPEIRVKVKIFRRSEIKNKRSPYLIAFYSEEKPMHLENIGFIGQQVVLELFSRGIGTCWWGLKKLKGEFKKHAGLHCIIAMSAGIPQDTTERVHPGDFPRKALKEIFYDSSPPPDTDGKKKEFENAVSPAVNDVIMEAVRVAPSAINYQPWFVLKIDDRYDFYLRPPKGLVERIMPDMRHIDIGIAMAHFMVQAQAEGLEVSFDFMGRDIRQGRHIAGIIAKLQWQMPIIIPPIPHFFT